MLNASQRYLLLQQSGYEAPATFGLNPDAPLLEIGHDEDEGTDDWTPPLALPPQILLRIRAQGKRLSERLSSVSPMIQYKQGDQILPPLALYSSAFGSVPLVRASQHEEIDLIYTGEGFYEHQGQFLSLSSTTPPFHLSLDPEQLLYRQSFQTESAPHTIGTQDFKSPLRVFRAFGGRWDGDAETAEQVYYEIEQTYPAQTAFSLSLASQLPTQNLLVFPEPDAQEKISLAQRIRKGDLCLFLKEEPNVLYTSSTYTHLTPDLLDIIFLPKTS